LPINKKVKSVALEQFRLNLFSPRIDLGDLTPLQLSLQAFGQVLPVITTPHSGGLAVIGGVRLIHAAKSLGWSHVQTLILKDLEPLQAYRLATFLNKQPWTIEEEQHLVSSLTVKYGLLPERIAALLHVPRRWVSRRFAQEV
jgi:ParB-like chromosome segregation protein Spo0J